MKLGRAFLFTLPLIALGTALGLTIAAGCTPLQRTVVREVVDIVERVCPDAPSTLECLRRTELAALPSAAPEASAVASSEPGGMPPGMAGTAAATAHPVAP